MSKYRLNPVNSSSVSLKPMPTLQALDTAKQIMANRLNISITDIEAVACYKGSLDYNLVRVSSNEVLAFLELESE